MSLFIYVLHSFKNRVGLIDINVVSTNLYKYGTEKILIFINMVWRKYYYHHTNSYHSLFVRSLNDLLIYLFL